MKRERENETTIDGILKQSMDSEVPPEVERRLRQHLSTFRERLESRPAKRRGLWRMFSWPRLALAGGTGLALLVVLMLVLLSGSDPAAKLYAAAMEALKTVRTIHITGWQSSIRKGHSSILDEPVKPGKRYEVEIWEWTGQDGRHRRYERLGPKTFWDDGERCYEYHKHTDTLYVGKSKRSNIPKLRRMAEFLKTFSKPGVRKTNLGQRTIGERLATGTRLEEAKSRRGEWWIDVHTHLPLVTVGYQWKDGVWTPVHKSTLTYDEKVPVAISHFTPPEAKQTHYDWEIDPRFEKWHLHLRRLAARYHNEPLPEKLALVPYENHERMEAYSAGLPGISGYWVWPIRGTLLDYLRQGTWVPRGLLRVPPAIGEVRLNHDLVIKSGVSERERQEFVLDFLGLEVVEATEERTVWVAHYDGRKLKPWRDVKAPVSSEGARAIGPGMVITWGANSMRDLFNGLVYWQDYNLTARGLLIVDETGLSTKARDPQSIAVSIESPCWVGGRETLEIAKRWFAEEFGVTFTEETRPVTVYVVRRQADR